MKMESQGSEECMLATLAALQGRSLEAARAEARALAGASWPELMAQRHQTAQATEKIWDTIHRLAGPLAPCFPRLATAPTGIPPMPAGKGTVMVFFNGCVHMIAYEDGLLYDPENPEIPRTQEEYLALYPGRIISLLFSPVPESAAKRDKSGPITQSVEGDQNG